MANDQRTRTYSWHDPVEMARVGRELSGLEYLTRMAAGELPPPPIASTLDFGLAVVEEGRVVFTCTPAEHHYNPIGSVHGGVYATLLDSALGCAVHSVLGAGTGYTSLELKVNFVKPLTRDTGEVYCEGRVVQVGGRVALAEGDIRDAAGKLYGTATTTCLIFRGK